MIKNTNVQIKYKKKKKKKGRCGMLEILQMSNRFRYEDQNDPYHSVRTMIDRI